MVTICINFVKSTMSKIPPLLKRHRFPTKCPRQLLFLDTVVLKWQILDLLFVAVIIGEKWDDF